MGSGSARLADQLAVTPGGDLRIETGVIASVAAGAAVDGNALVTVTWRGTNVACPYLAGYAPTVGHNVLLLVQPPQLVILGRLIGTPS
jgi:hypothetical protein